MRAPCGGAGLLPVYCQAAWTYVSWLVSQGHPAMLVMVGALGSGCGEEELCHFFHLRGCAEIILDKAMIVANPW